MPVEKERRRLGSPLHLVVMVIRGRLGGRGKAGARAGRLAAEARGQHRLLGGRRRGRESGLGEQSPPPEEPGRSKQRATDGIRRSAPRAEDDRQQYALRSRCGHELLEAGADREAHTDEAMLGTGRAPWWSVRSPQCPRPMPGATPPSAARFVDVEVQVPWLPQAALLRLAPAMREYSATPRDIARFEPLVRSGRVSSARIRR